MHEEAIPDPPEVRIIRTTPQGDGILLEWAATSDPPAELRYLVQYEDRPGVWRGVAPRTTEPRMLLPQRRFAGRRLTVRVLASSGIATGAASETVEFARTGGPGEASIIVVGSTRGEVSPFIQARAPHREPGAGTLAWYDEQGAELSAGSRLDTGRLPDGDNVIRAVWWGAGRLEQRAWLLTKERGAAVSIRDLAPRPPDEPHIHPHVRD